MSDKNYSGENTIKAIIKNVRNRYASKTHEHNFADLSNKPSTLEGYGITDTVAFIDAEDNEEVSDSETVIVVDSALSTTSTNPVQNKVVTEKFSQVEQTIADLQALLVDGNEVAY